VVRRSWFCLKEERFYDYPPAVKKGEMEFLMQAGIIFLSPEISHQELHPDLPNSGSIFAFRKAF
jgi:hypothetical protein